MNNDNYIPKKLKQIKGAITARFNMTDILVLGIHMIFMVIAMSTLGINAEGISKNIPLILITVTLGASGMYLVAPNKYGRKRYLYVIDMLKFKSEQTTFEGDKQVHAIFPFTHTDGNMLVGEKTHMMVMKVKGVSIFQFNEERQELLADQFKNVLNVTELPLQISKFSRKMDYLASGAALTNKLHKMIVEYLSVNEIPVEDFKVSTDKLITIFKDNTKDLAEYVRVLDLTGDYRHKLKEGEDTDQAAKMLTESLLTYFARHKITVGSKKDIETLLSILESKVDIDPTTYIALNIRIQLIEDAANGVKGLTASNEKETAYFISISDTSAKRLNKEAIKLRRALSEAGFDPLLLTNDQLPAYVSSVFRKNNYTLSEKKKLEDVIPKTIDFKKEYTVIENRDNTRYIKVLDIYSLPLTVPAGWLADVFDLSEDNYFVRIEKMNIEHARTLFDKKLRIQEENRITKASSSSEQYDMDHVDTAMHEVLSSITRGETMYWLAIKVELVASTKEELAEKLSNLRSALRRMPGYKMDPFDYRQKLGYASILGRSYDRTFSEEAHNIPLSSLANGYPLMLSSIHDFATPITGYTRDGSPVMVNTRTRDEERTNSSILIVGKSGSGKSFFAKKLTKDSVATGSKIFIIDPQDEWGVLTKNLKGTIIKMGASSEHKINPLEFYTTGEEVEGARLGGHLVFVKDFLTAAANLDASESRYIPKYLKSFFASNKIDESTIGKMKSESWPILEDFSKFLIKTVKGYNDTDKDIIDSLAKKIALMLDNDLKNTLWNCKSKFKIDKSTITTFNTQELYTLGNSEIMMAQTSLIIRIVNKYVSDNKSVNFKPIEKLSHEIKRAEGEIAYINTNLEKARHMEKIALLKTKKREAMNKWGSKNVTLLVDEAHLLLDKDNIIAIKFLAAAVKTFRKYNTEVVIITQNLEDFKLGGELSKYSKTIITNNQYLFAFKLNSEDVSDLDELLKQSGGLTPADKNTIISAPTGTCLVKISETQKQIMDVIVTDKEKEIITGGV